MHATSCAAERNWSVWGLLYAKLRSRLLLANAMPFVKANHDLRASGEERLVVI
jgi:hypothetical protein